MAESQPGPAVRRSRKELDELDRRLRENHRLSTVRRLLQGGRDYVYDPESGLQGIWQPEDRWEGLAALLQRARGLSLLDLGCAEGHVIEQFLRAGVVCAHGFDSQRRRVRSARRRLPDPRVSLQVGDFGNWERFLAGHSLAPAYDIVLLLSVYQKLPPGTRDQVLRGALMRCRTFFGLRLPRPLIDAPSQIVVGAGFGLLYEFCSPAAGDSLRVFQRIPNP